MKNIFKFEAPIQIVLLYILSSFPMGFPAASLAKWLYKNGTPAQVNAYYGVCFLPWSYKVVFGVISDIFPVFKLRRKPYMFIYSLLAAIGQLYFALYAKTIGHAMVIGFLVNCGLAGAEMLFDSLVVEMVKQNDARASVLQSACMQYRSVGTIISNVCSLVLLHYKVSEQWFIGLTALFPLASAFVVLTYKELPAPKISAKQVGNTLLTFFKSLFSKNQPLIIVFLFLFSIALMPTTLELMYNYEFSLNFSTFTVQALMFISSGGSFLGAWLFKKFSSKQKLWKTFLYTATFSSFSGLTQIILSEKYYKNIGIPASWFGAVDGGIISTFRTMAFMPVIVLACSAAPAGIEATAYAALMSSTDIASSLQDFLGGFLINQFGIKAGHWGNLWKYIVLCNILAPLPLLLLFVKPLRRLLTKSSPTNESASSTTPEDSQPLLNSITTNKSPTSSSPKPKVLQPTTTNFLINPLEGDRFLPAPIPFGEVDTTEVPLLVSAANSNSPTPSCTPP
eukprot:TRINITY_DN8356_c0_g2_i2.p1 TRINITY_DN8356_c0_g2~~TRINITY_DN8356_c0_g2_i2.p1  ORF type:complete len:508 (-),score=82.87 TRINITY_DN8356_c0_g2_i2:624-2147(-)